MGLKRSFKNIEIKSNKLLNTLLILLNYIKHEKFTF